MLFEIKLFSFDGQMAKIKILDKNCILQFKDISSIIKKL